MSEELKDSGTVTALSVIGLVFGLIGMLGSFIPCIGSLAFYIGIPAAIVSGIALWIAYTQKAKRTFAIVALTISLIGVVISGWQYFSITSAGKHAQRELQKMASRNTISKDISKITEKIASEKKVTDNRKEVMVDIRPKIIGQIKPGLKIKNIKILPPKIKAKHDCAGIYDEIEFNDYFKEIAIVEIDISSWKKSGEIETIVKTGGPPCVKFVNSANRVKVRITLEETSEDYVELEPVRAIGEIRSPKLIKQVDPIYPEIARQARVEGIVILEAQTDIYGRVQTVKVLRSIPLLDQAAIEAVRQYIYEPMIIDGRPRGVIFNVTVRFTLE